MPQTNNLFILNLPDGWKETTVYTFEGPHDSGLLHNLVLVIDPKPSDEVDLKSYVHAQIHNSLSNLSGFEMVSEKELGTANGNAAYLICYKQVPAPEQILFQKQLYIMDKKAICIFTFLKAQRQRMVRQRVLPSPPPWCRCSPASRCARTWP